MISRDSRHYWAGQKNLVKGCLQTLDCYCASCELLSASIANSLLFVNILVSGIFHGCFAQRLAVNKPCLQIVRHLLWKQTTTHSLRNNNPMFDGNLWPNSFDQPSRCWSEYWHSVLALGHQLLLQQPLHCRRQSWDLHSVRYIEEPEGSSISGWIASWNDEGFLQLDCWVVVGECT